MSGRHSQGLGRAERIRRRPEFEHAYNRGTRIRGRFMTIFVAPNGQQRARFGVAATRKLGSAVVRNRAKRLARELFRQHKPAAGLDIVIVPRREMLDASFGSLETDYLTCLDRCPRGGQGPAAQPRSGGRRARAASRV